MEIKINRLVIITCLALICLIAFQLFWLNQAYKNEKKNLQISSKNIVVQTIVSSGLKSPLTKNALEFLIKNEEFLAKNLIDSSDQSEFDLNPIIYTELSDSDEAHQNIVAPSSFVSMSLAEFENRLKSNFKSMGFDIPFEVGLIDYKGSVLSATTNLNYFRNIPTKTIYDRNQAVILNENEKGVVQLAFPNIVFNILKSVWIMVTISCLLIFICTFSFIYMINLFYKQKREIEVKNDFLNNMTHELKTPISGASLALQLIMDPMIKNDQAAFDDYSQTATNELLRLEKLVDKVLNISAYERTEVNIKKSKIDIISIINETIFNLRSIFNNIKYAIHTDYKPNSIDIVADKTLMVSMFQNLIENAIKYRDNKKERLELVIKVHEHVNSIKISITDNGKGIESIYKDKIFEKFFRIPTGDQHDEKGHGLGLSYVKEIVSMHKGKIEIDSIVGKGTIFEIIIPK